MAASYCSIFGGKSKASHWLAEQEMESWKVLETTRSQTNKSPGEPISSINHIFEKRENAGLLLAGNTGNRFVEGSGIRKLPGQEGLLGTQDT